MDTRGDDDKERTRQLEINEGGARFGDRVVRVRVTSDRIGRESIKRAAKRAGPGPLIELTVSVEVSVAVFAARKEMAVGSVRWSDSGLVFGGEWRYCESPGES